jgi:predicted nucleic acid-binding protein
VTYADSSFLLSLLGNDGNTPAAHAWAAGLKSPPLIPWTAFGAFEFNNAARNLAFRRVIDTGILRKIQARLRQQLSNGMMETAPLPVYLHYQEAERLSRLHTVRNGSRSLDVLHVAAARVLGARTFLTFDGRQAAFSALAGLSREP